jgi:hypothetical protein
MTRVVEFYHVGQPQPVTLPAGFVSLLASGDGSLTDYCVEFNAANPDDLIAYACIVDINNDAEVIESWRGPEGLMLFGNIKSGELIPISWPFPEEEDHDKKLAEWAGRVLAVGADADVPVAARVEDPEGNILGRWVNEDA